MASNFEQIAEFLLSLVFIALLVYTVYKLLVLIKDSIGAQKSMAQKGWVIFIWLVFFVPFALLVYMITTRDPDEDKRIKQRAWELSVRKGRPTLGP